MPIGPSGKCPEEAFTGRKVSVNHVRTFGCIAYADIPKENRGKFEPTTRKTIFIGYLPTSKQYKLYDPVTKDIIVSIAPKFVKDEFWSWPDEPKEPGVDVDVLDPMELVDFDLNDLLGTPADEADSPAAEPGENQPQEQPREAAADVVRPQDEAGDDLRPQGAREEEVTDEDTIVVDTGSPVDVRNDPQEGGAPQSEGAQAPQRRSGRERRPKRIFEQALAAQDRPAIPTSYEEAVNDPIYGPYWKDSIEDELLKLQALDTWEFADLPDGKRPVGSKWVFTVKYTPTGLLDRFKARLVAQGFSQVPGDDFTETFSPTVRFESLRTLLAIGTYLDWEIHQTDVVSAYPRSVLHANVYMRPPKGMQAPPKKVLRVKKSLYGLKQSGREWYLEACKGLEELDLYPIFADACIFVRKDQRLIVGLYVDDMVILAEDLEAVQSFKAGIAKRWEIKDLGEVKKILGLEITRDRANRTIKITQTAYADELIEEYGLTDAREARTPPASLELLEPTSEKDPLANIDQYGRVVGELMFLMRGSRPDTCFVVTRLSRYTSKPAQRHWNCAMQMLRYVKGTRKYGISFSANGKGERIEGYVDSDYAGDRTDRRSTYGSVFMLFGGPLSWSSRKQRSVSTSTTEAEYVALCQGSKEAIWFRDLFKELGFTQFLGDSREVQMYSDNQGCIALAENPENHARSKHIDVQYHYTRQLVEYGKIKLDYCPTEDMLADVLTKPLGFRAFHACIQRLVGP
jgi:hypothetical protein